MIKLVKSSFLDEYKTKKELSDFIMQCNRFSMGEQCRKFEISFAEKQQRKFAVFVSSGSMANLVLIQSLLNLGKLNKGDRVAVSALTSSRRVQNNLNSIAFARLSAVRIISSHSFSSGVT